MVLGVPIFKHFKVYVERVKHYSINGCMHVVPISLRFRGGGGRGGEGVVMRMGTQQ